MPRIQPVQPTDADEKTRKLLDTVQRGLGMVPNMAKTLAHSSAALAGYLNFNQAIGGALTPALREQVSLAIAGFNRCDYCASAHTLLGRNAGIANDELIANLAGESADDKTQARLSFALAVVERRGQITDDELQLIRAAGPTDAQIVEIVAVVALNVFTNYLNHVIETEVDFPVAPELAAV